MTKKFHFEKISKSKTSLRKHFLSINYLIVSIFFLPLSFAFPEGNEDTESELIENSFIVTSRPNYVHYHAFTSKNNEGFQDRFRLRQNIRKQIRLIAEYLRPQTPNNPKLAIQTESQFKWGTLHLSHQSQKSEQTLLGTELQSRFENLNSKLVIAQLFFRESSGLEPFYYSRTNIEIFPSTQWTLLYKKSSSAYKRWSGSIFSLTDQLQMILTQTFLEDATVALYYKKNTTQSIRTEFKYILKDGSHLRIKLTAWETGKSLWTFQYNHLSNPISILISRLDWAKPAQEEASINLSNTVKLKLSNNISMIGGFKLKRDDKTLKEKNILLGLQIQKEASEIILQWRSYEPEESRDNLSLGLQYRWN